MSYDALFSPIKLRGLELKNRVVLPGMNTKMVKDKNDVGEDLPAYHAARAAGGCGLNIVELVSICPECHAYLYLGLYNEHHRDQLRKITDAIHAAGGKAGVQIWHGGFVPEEFFDKTNKLETPDTLTVERIHEIVKQFGYSAKLAVEAGFDALEFHGAHTYLPHEFMNPSLNKRTDEYGNQSLENRCRFNLEVIREMRKNMPEDMPLLMRLDAIDEMLPAVTTQDETVQFINWAAEAGVDAIDLSRRLGRTVVRARSARCAAVIIRAVAARAAAVHRAVVRTLGRGLCLLDGQIDLPIRRHGQHAHLHLITQLQKLVDVVDVGVGDLGYVHQTAPAVRQAHKRAKLRDTGDGTLHNCSDFHLHTVRFSLLNHSCRKKSSHRA